MNEDATLYGHRHVSGAAGNFDNDRASEYILSLEKNNGITEFRVYNADVNGTNITAGAYSSLSLTLPLYVDGAGNELNSIGGVVLTAGDFDGDNKDEALVAYRDQNTGFLAMRILYFDSNGNLMATADFGDEYSGFTLFGSQSFESFDVQAIDLDFDGNDEIVIASSDFVLGALHPFIKVYDIAGSGAGFTFIPKDRKEITPINSTDVLTVSLAYGDFNGDLFREIALTFSYQMDIDDNTFVHMFQIADLTATPEIDYLEALVPIPTVLSFSTGETGLPNIDTGAGDSDGNGKDELIVMANVSSRIWEFDANFNGTNIGSIATLSTVEGARYSKFLAIGDMNGDSRAEVAVFNNQYDYDSTPNGESKIGFQVFNRALNSNTWQNVINQPSAQVMSLQGGPPKPVMMMLFGDFDGDGLQLGEPNHTVLTDLVEPIIVLNSVPTHSDNANGNFTDVNSVFQGGSCSGWDASYSTIQGTTTSLTTTAKSDWSVSAQIGGGANFGVVDIEASITASYGESFENTSGSESISQIVNTQTSCFDDVVFAAVSTYDVYEYPVYQGNVLICYALSMVPRAESVNYEWIRSSDNRIASYIPTHERGNILSYRQLNSDAFPDPSSPNTIFNCNEGTIDFGTGPSWTTTTGLTITNSFSETVDVGVGASASVSAFGFSAEASGEYNFGNVKTRSNSVTNELSFSISPSQLSPTASDKNYKIKPYIFWNNGILTLDYGTSTLGSWYDLYAIQDPAFNLPFRLNVERGFDTQPQPKRYEGRSIRLSTRNPMPNDTITVYVRVYNYSNTATDGPVPVSLFLGNPLWGGVLQTDLAGNTVFTTSGAIDPQSYQEIAIQWITPADNSVIGKIYAQIDPAGTLTEVHEDNNICYQFLGVYFPNTDEQDPNSIYEDKRGNDLLIYPNPAYDDVHLRFHGGEDKTVLIYDSFGRLVQTERLFGYPTGENFQTISISNLAAGCYILKLQGQRSSSVLPLQIR